MLGWQAQAQLHPETPAPPFNPPGCATGETGKAPGHVTDSANTNGMSCSVQKGNSADRPGSQVTQVI